MDNDRSQIMQRALETPKKTEVHDSMDFAISEKSLRGALAKTSWGQQLEIRFTNYIGNTFAGMPRPSVTYYPVFAVFLLGRGRCYNTFDDYQLTSGNTALVYPVNRQIKNSIRRALLEQAIPACSTWLESLPANQQKAAGYYVMHDHTFHELVFGPHGISVVRFNWRGKFLKGSQATLKLEQPMP